MKKFNSIKTLIQRIFYQNKNRNTVAIIAIILTTLMFTTLFVLIQSMNENTIEMAFRQVGNDTQVSFKHITDAQANIIAANPKVIDINHSIVLGFAEDNKLSGRQLEIRWGDDNYAKHSFSLPTTGSMPQKENEIALDTLVLDRLGISHELGQTVTLTWRKENAAKNEITTSTFILCGFWECNESSYASMAWVSRSFIDKITHMTSSAVPGQTLETHMAQLILNTNKHIEKTMDSILTDCGLDDLEYNINLAYVKENTASMIQENLSMYFGMVLVFLAGYLIIYNIFQISVVTDIQFYGKLKLLGTTTKQIKKLIYWNANLLCIVGIPIGLFIGYVLGVQLVPILISWKNVDVSVSAKPIIFIGSTLFAWFTVLISCILPARLAGKISPIEALHYTDMGNTIKKKTKKKNSYSTTLWAMAWSNLGRNKKRTFIIICSLVLALVLLSSFYAKDAAFDIEKYLTSFVLSDFQLEDTNSNNYGSGYVPYKTTLNDALIQQIKNSKGLEKTGHIYSKEIIINLSDEAVQNMKHYYNEDRLTHWANYNPDEAQACIDAMENQRTRSVIWGADGLPLETITQPQYILDGSFDAEKFSTGNYILAIGPATNEEMIRLPTYSVGSQLTLEGKTFTVMAIVYPLQSFVSGAYEDTSSPPFDLSFIIHSNTFQNVWPNNTLRKFYFNIDDKEIKHVQTMLDEYISNVDSSLSVTSRKTMAEQYKRQTNSLSVTGNTISIVIGLVGLLNFINSMVTSIIARRKELVMMQSLGMTKKQLCRMLIYEGLAYSGLTLIISYIMSALIVGIVIRIMVSDGFSTFHFTLLPLVLCTPAMLIFAILIPFLCFKNLEKQSIVERLRIE